MKDKRLAIISISVRNFMELLFDANKQDFVRLPVINSLPDDVEVIAVQYNFQSESFDIKIKSKEFDIVRALERCPYKELKYEIVEVQKGNEKSNF